MKLRQRSGKKKNKKFADTQVTGQIEITARERSGISAKALREKKKSGKEPGTTKE